MDKLSKRILREMHTSNQNKSTVCTYMSRFDMKNAIMIDELAKKVGASTEKTVLASKYLCEEGFASYKYLGEHKAGFSLTHKGNNYFRFWFELHVLRWINTGIAVLALIISIVE